MATGAESVHVGAHYCCGGEMGGIGSWVDAEPGVRRRILQAEGRLMLMEVHFAAGAAGYEHSHVHEQISYCVAGSFEYSLDGRIRTLARGESVYVPGNVRHGARALEEGTLIDVFTPVREDLLAPG
jgi:quercetin dioxygenase-like cupin family protein